MSSSNHSSHRDSILMKLDEFKSFSETIDHKIKLKFKPIADPQEFQEKKEALGKANSKSVRTSGQPSSFLPGMLDLYGEIRTKNAQIEDLEKKLEAVHQERQKDKVAQEQVEALTEQVRSLKFKSRSQDFEITAYRKLVQDMEVELGNFEEREDEYLEKLESNEEDIQSKNGVVEAVEVVVQSLKEAASQLLSQDPEDPEEPKNASEAFTDNDSDLSLYVEVLESMEATIKELQGNLKREKTRSRNLQTQIHRQSRQEKRLTTSLKAKLVKKESQRVKLIKNLHVAEKKIQELRETRAFLKDSLDIATTDFEEQRKTLFDETQKRHNLENLLIRKVDEKDDFKQQVEAQKFQIEYLEGQLEEVQKEALKQLVMTAEKTEEERWANKFSMQLAELDRLGEVVAKAVESKKNQEKAAEQREAHLQR
ncbi:hypothetical protein L596_021837 [Steinernema carpocapsae]|uniref:Uncharacterized protein n=1 Tax=Steinernema carpocapsae TaxID=34508 RepID=A0A4U5MK03_STECR|nr:hypothetical protein L596_021837 [Steinernema carpocapsae]